MLSPSGPVLCSSANCAISRVSGCCEAVVLALLAANGYSDGSGEVVSLVECIGGH